MSLLPSNYVAQRYTARPAARGASRRLALARDSLFCNIAGTNVICMQLLLDNYLLLFSYYLTIGTRRHFVVQLNIRRTLRHKGNF